MISSSQVEWHGLISKGSSGIDDVDFGEVREVDSDYVITERDLSIRSGSIFRSMRYKDMIITGFTLG